MNTPYIIALVVFLLVIALLVVFRNSITAGVSKLTAGSPQSDSSTPSGNTPVVLDYDKLLKKGTTGPEVKRLQQWLGITADGIFGNKTEAALYDRKGTKQITLNEFQHVYADMGGTQAPPDPQSAGDDVIGFSYSNPNESFLSQAGGWLFNWLS